MSDFPFALPVFLTVAGQTYAIRTDYRDILRVLLAFEDAELEQSEKLELLLENIYIDVDTIPRADIQAAVTAAMEFIDAGQEPDGRSARCMDWEQDAPLLFPAINRVAGGEVRSVPYLHWWTFLGYFMEIRESTFSNVLSLRQKRNRGKKLEKHEQEYWTQNKKICELRRRDTAEQKAEYERLNNMTKAWFA